jgi:DNA-binding beta-propeller fold protein YncE
MTNSKYFLLGLLAATLFWACHAGQKTSAYSGVHSNPLPKALRLPNGWSLSPAGRSLPLGDFPMNTALSPDGQLLAVTNNGVGRQFIQLIDVATEKQVDSISVKKAWYGLTFSKDGKHLFASGGTGNNIMVFSVNDHRQLHRDTSIRLGKPWPHKIWPAGLAVDDARNQLFVCTREDSSLYICDTRNFRVLNSIKLESEAYSCAVSPDGSVFVSLWGARKVAVLDARTLVRKTDIPAGEHPNELIMSRNGQTLFVANALDNSVTVADARSGKVLEVLNAALYPDAPNGSTTNSLALSPDEKKLYVANADNNCLAVFDVSKPGESHSLGFIPTGWYPTSVRATGTKILVANGKGFASQANPDGPQPTFKKEDHRGGQYIGALFLGTLSFIDAPDKQTLAVWSKQVYDNTPYTKEKERNAAGEPGNPVPMRVGDPSPIKYVFYIVKENRTYDQVLGDIPQGNGDSSLTLFGEKVTPNLHGLAHDFVLLDNFYVDAEVSADGHNWSMGAYANDYVEKTWPTEYGGRGGDYDYEGTRKLAHPKGGYIWDDCARNGVTYRTYGEFADDYKANYPTLAGHICPGYSSWDLNIPDVEREKVWEQDFDDLLKKGAVPRFNTVRLGNDHTSGMAKGAYAPKTAVADNDRAVGLLVEHLSQSSLWKESVVFILEDDAQNGPDHVDAHRSIAFMAGGFVKRGLVDHTMYSTSSMLRTLELILGMPPMSQYDAAATPMWRCFGMKPDLTPWKARTNQIPLDARNTSSDALSKISATFDLTDVDEVPERLFNEVLWKSIKGIQSVMPAPRRGAWVQERVK